MSSELRLFRTRYGSIIRDAEQAADAGQSSTMDQLGRVEEVSLAQFSQFPKGLLNGKLPNLPHQRIEYADLRGVQANLVC